MRIIKLTSTICYILFVASSSAQIDQKYIRDFLSNDSNLKSVPLQYPTQVKRFYTIFNFNTAWISNHSNQHIFLQLLNQTNSLGLQEKDYQLTFLQSYTNHTYPLNTGYDSLFAELYFTDITIHFFRDIVYGNHPPVLDYNGLKYNPDCTDVTTLLATAIEHNQLNGLLNAVEIKSKEYLSLKNKIIQYNNIIEDKHFKEILITSNQLNTNNVAFLNKLYQLGFIESDTAKITDLQLITKLKMAQRFLGLYDDGLLKSATINALNIPLASRVAELSLALNTIRWLNCIKQSASAITINLPSANLVLYKNGKVLLASRIIVGKKTTPTPTQSSKITEVILNPRWTVPYKIASKELLPIIQKNSSYLEDNNFEVLDEYGQIIDPSTIDWASLSTKKFPYTLRQSSGTGNSLGIIKLNFYNPFNTYLHDTPQKGLFKKNKRYFSHGCMRVEKIMPLAHLLLDKKTLMNANKLKEKDSLYGHAPTILSTKEKIPILILYNTAWVDAEGKIGFYEDVYDKLSLQKKDNIKQ